VQSCFCQVFSIQVKKLNSFRKHDIFFKNFISFNNYNFFIISIYLATNNRVLVLKRVSCVVHIVTGFVL
jgi:hypothetical protein